MASLLEQALATLVNTFQEYSQSSGNSLCQAKFKELLEKELPTWAPTALRECDYKQLVSALDTDKDGRVDFVEYMRLLACLCVCCHEYLKDSPLKPSCSQ
ncbi:protein S100-A3 [Oryx dammah]|uniref:protein S100-A3 n=1 Tax=Oryx dammah TaxID=59534 RepID=UPI001A9BFE82|nr:protein S100-A3 [Oryx dammah]XP_040086485.1 protein S100-A3 [Oryx dammah]